MNRLKSIRLLGFLGLTMSFSLLGASCGNDSERKTPLPQPQQTLANPTENCGAQIFELGRPIAQNELLSYGRAKFTLEGVYFRDVVTGNGNRVELAYRAEMKMERADHFRGQTPVFQIACREESPVPGRRSVRAEKLSRTTIPVLGDLHLPSTRITIYDDTRDSEGSDRDRLYNRSRISDMTVSKSGYFSFLESQSKSYRGIVNLGQYMDLLRKRYFFTTVELREMSYGRLAIYAEKNFSGEHSQLMITLVN